MLGFDLVRCHRESARSIEFVKVFRTVLGNRVAAKRLIECDQNNSNLERSVLERSELGQPEFEPPELAQPELKTRERSELVLQQSREGHSLDSSCIFKLPAAFELFEPSSYLELDGLASATFLKSEFLIRHWHGGGQ